MKRSEKEKQSLFRPQEAKEQNFFVLRVYQLRINGMYTAILGIFMSPGIELNILFLIIHKNF